jgi:nitrite reductase/ring-hydroxylating ferredoxin subunit
MTGWVPLHPCDHVEPGSVLAADVGSLELVVWRTFDGRAVVMDARCPHQWSHLEAEGFVDGDELVCTAHFWRFGTTGCGTKLNVLGRRDAKSDIDVYPSREHDGMIEAMLVPSPAEHSAEEQDD